MKKTLLLFGLVSLALASVDPLSQEFIDIINGIKTTWKAGHNFPAGTTNEHLRRLAGVLPVPEVYKAPIRRHRMPEGFDLSDSFDGREEWPECPTVKEIRDQGNCGSCWAVAAVSAMSDRACVHTQGKENFRYSSENLLSCCSSCGYGCDGGYVGPSFDYWVNQGIVSGGPYGSNEGCQPYTIPPTGYETIMKTDLTPPCTSECQAEYGTAYQADLRYATDSYMVAKEEAEIRFEIRTNGPVEVSFDVYEDFYAYTTGIYQHVFGDYVGGHAVKIIGWGEEAGTPYWIISNSWNVSWGESGFFKMIRGVDDCAIESNVYGGTPKPL